MIANMLLGLFGSTLFIGAAAELAGKPGVLCATGLCIFIVTVGKRIIEVVKGGEDA